jgi:quinolinate synthase
MQLNVLTDYEREHINERQPLPEKYLGLSVEEMDRRIAAAREKLGSRLLILGHHYQRDEVIKFADYTGDSWKLSQHCTTHREADYVIFCGVHFMAESADILAAPHQQVILPDLAAGCSMADMAAADQLEMCWKELEQMGVTNVVPVTYINSAASIKSFVGERGGTVCTSGNAQATLKWAWERGERILFLPDQHLGRNTAYKMGVPQHRLQDGRAARRDGGVGSERDLGRPRAVRSQSREDDSVEGPLLRPHALHGEAD